MLSGPISSHVYLERRCSEIKGQKQRVVCSFISASSDGGWQFLQLTPPGAIIALRVCACVTVCQCVCILPHLGPPALLDLSGSDVLLAAHYEQSISASHIAASRKDFNIVLLFLESFVLFFFSPANLWRKLWQWVAHLYLMIFLVMSLLVISSLTEKTGCK